VEESRDSILWLFPLRRHITNIRGMKVTPKTIQYFSTFPIDRLCAKIGTLKRSYGINDASSFLF